MALELKGVSKVVDGKTHVYPTDLRLEKSTMNVLLGPTLSGKTTLMRLMAKGRLGEVTMAARRPW
jgi:glycerol transport system ATP-binding protein